MSKQEEPPKSIDGVRKPAQVLDLRSSAPDTPDRRPQPAADESTSKQVPPQSDNLSDVDLGEIDPDLAATEAAPLRWYQVAARGRRFVKKHIHHFGGKRLALYAGGVVLIVAGFFAARFWLASNQIIVRDGEGAAALQDDVDPTQLRGEGDGRVNVLLIGIGGEQHKAGSLADTIMLVSLDPISKDVAMLSIPRDLWVDIPDHGSNKINAAHAFGERYNYPGGGPALLRKTVEQTLDVPIHYFARVDFQGFKQAVDTVGGIKVDVKETINDYAYPDQQLRGYDPFYIEAGTQHMDGETALKYARSRYTTSDFDRSQRQRQILIALKNKALNIGTLTNPLKLNSLMDAAGDHLRTDLQLNEILKLVEMAKEVQPEQILSAGLDNSPDNFLASQGINGASALVPRAGDFSAIQEYVRGLLVDGFIKEEDARIAVQNGTGTPDLATRTTTLLKTFGYNVVSTSNADHTHYEQTVIYDHHEGENPYTIRYLEQRFGVDAQTQPSNTEDGPDITIIVGQDYTPGTSGDHW